MSLFARFEVTENYITELSGRVKNINVASSDEIKDIIRKQNLLETSLAELKKLFRQYMYAFVPTMQERLFQSYNGQQLEDDILTEYTEFFCEKTDNVPSKPLSTPRFDSLSTSDSQKLIHIDDHKYTVEMKMPVLPKQAEEEEETEDSSEEED